MAVAHRASATFAAADGTTGGTITIPASVQAGDDLYVPVMSRAAGAVTCVDDDATGNLWTTLGSIDGILWLFWKKATAATASKTVTIAGAVNSCTGGLSAFSGGLAGNPTTNLNFENNPSGTPNQVHATFTPDAAKSMICIGISLFSAVNPITLIACTDPGSLEPELWERTSTGGSDCYVVFTGRLQAGGPTATGTFSWAQTATGSGRSVAFAIQPEPGVTATIANTLTGVTQAAGSDLLVEAVMG